MRYRMEPVLIVLALVSLAAPALADDQTSFQKLLANPVEQQHVLTTAQHTAVMLANPCPSATYGLGNSITVYRPPSFDVQGHLTAGAWKQTVNEQGCGAKRVLNILVLVPQPQQIETSPLLPGTTLADPILQRDAVRMAVIAVGGPEPNCRVGYVADTQFLGQENAPAANGKAPPWRELWTLMSCTKKMMVPMRFVPDRTGTAISAGPKSAIEITPLTPQRN